MTAREVLAIAFKLFAIWLMAQILIQLPSHAMTLFALVANELVNSNWWVEFFSLLMLVLGGVVCFGMFKLADNILKVDSVNEVNIDVDDQKYLLQLGGFFLLVTGCIWFPNSLKVFYRNWASDTPIFLLYAPIGYGLQILMGLWLTVHPSWWVALLKKLRDHA